MAEEKKDEKKVSPLKADTALIGLHKKLALVQSALKAPKNQFNKFGNYKYRSAEDILEAVKPLAIYVGAIVTIRDDIVLVGDRYYVKAEVRFGDADHPEVPAITTTAFAREEEQKKGMDGSQVTGASSSYARKYALNGMFCIDDTKDSDATNRHGFGGEQQPTPQQEKTPASRLSELRMKAWKSFKGLVGEMPPEEMKSLFKDKIESLCGKKATELSEGDWQDVCNAIADGKKFLES